MSDISPYIYMLVFIAGLAFSESIFLFLTSGDKSRQQEIANERLKRHASRLQTTTDAEVQSIFRDSETRGPILRLLTRMIPDRRPLDLLLYRAGVRIQLETFMGVSFLCGLVGFGFANFFLGTPVVVAASPLASLIPYVYVRRKRTERMNLFMEQLPEAIDLLARALKAGHPFKAGLALASEEMDDPVGGEFGQAVEEMALGLDPRVALENLGLRMNTPDMPFFITAILIQRETGGNLPRVLEGLSRTMRDRVQFQGKVRALTAQTAISANVLALFPPVFVVFLNFFNPGYLEPLYTPGVGQWILGTAFTLTFVGWYFCRRLTEIKV